MNALIVAVDHLLITSTDFDGDLHHYTKLLGSHATPLGNAPSRCAILDGGNLAVRLQEQSGGSPGLAGVCFHTSDLDRLQRRLQRLGLAPAGDDDSAKGVDHDTRELWLAPTPERSYRLGFTGQRTRSPAAGAAGVSGLDHVVVASGDATRTAFLLAAQLGLDLRMDLSRPDWDARLLFFRCGDTIVEVYEKLSRDPDARSAADRLYGLSWRVADADARRRELVAQGFDVSELRDGRKAGTRVFTIRDRCAGVATLMLEPPA